MFPILVKIGPLTLHTYGLMVALGFLAAYTLARRRFESAGIPLVFFDGLATLLMVAGLAGGRLLYFLTSEPTLLIRDPLQFVRVWEGGLVYYGGFLGALLALWIFSWWKELPYFALTDLLAAPLLLGQALGRVGCFAAGCCYGRPTKSIFGVTFHNPSSLAPLGLSLHPVQLYSAFGDLLIFAGLLWLERKPRRRGVSTAAYLLAYGMGRFLMEYVRADDRGPVFATFSPSQWISILAVLAGGVLLAYVQISKRDPSPN